MKLSFYNEPQRLRLYAVRDCGLLTCPPKQDFMRGRMLELPMKPLLHIAFVSRSVFFFIIICFLLLYYVFCITFGNS